MFVVLLCLGTISEDFFPPISECAESESKPQIQTSTQRLEWKDPPTRCTSEIPKKDAAMPLDSHCNSGISDDNAYHQLPSDVPNVYPVS